MVKKPCKQAQHAKLYWEEEARMVVGVEDWRHFEKMKFNEPGMQKAGWSKSPVSRHSVQSYSGKKKRVWLLEMGIGEILRK